MHHLIHLRPFFSVGNHYTLLSPFLKSNLHCCLLLLFSRLLVESRLPEIKNVVLLQTMMRVVGKDAPLNLKRKLEVGFWVWIVTMLGVQAPVCVILTSPGIMIASSWPLTFLPPSSQFTVCTVCNCWMYWYSAFPVLATIQSVLHMSAFTDPHTFIHSL